MTPDDDRREKEFFEAQSFEERRMRFMGGVSLPRAAIRHLTHIDFSRDFAIVAVDRATDALAGVARYVHEQNSEPSHIVAHAAVAVLKKYQRMGLAFYLLTSVFEAARDAGVATLVADILSVNHASRILFSKVARRAGAMEKCVAREGRSNTWHYHLAGTAESLARCTCEGENVAAERVVTSTPSKFDLDESRHPRSLWRRDLVFPSGLRVEIRPADADDRQRLANFLRSAIQTKNPAGDLQVALSDVLPDAPDFTSGFMFVAIDVASDELAGVAYFHRGTDDAQMQVLVAPCYRGLGIADVLVTEIMRAASTDVATPARSSM